MSTRVSGPLRLVTDAPAMLVQVLVRAPKPRPHAGGMLVDFTTPATVADGEVEFPCVPGPAVLVVVNASVPQVTVPLVVPDKPDATLEECIRAAELADTATRSELEDLARRIVEGVSQAEQAASAAAESAGAAKDDRREVASDREAVEGYHAQVVSLHGEAVDARGVAEAAAETATGHATTATDKAGAAAESAAAAGESEANAAASEKEATRQAEHARSEAGRATEEADRASQSAADSSVKAVSDKVNELLAGAPEAYDTLLEIAEELERSQSAEAALVKEIAGKANIRDVPTTDDGYNTRNASDPAGDYPSGVSYSMNNGVSRGWNDVIQADTGYNSFGTFVMVQTLRHRAYSKSTTQLVFAYNDEHRPVFMRKWYGEAWGPFRSLTDDGHTHTMSQVTGLQSALDGKSPTSHTHTVADVTDLQAKVEPIVADYIGDDRVIQDAAASAVRDQLASQTVTRITSGNIDDLRNGSDAGEYVVSSVAAARAIVGWPVPQPGYLRNRTAGIPTQEVITYTSSGPRVWWREWRPGPQSWSDWVEMGKTLQAQSEAALEHTVREDAARKRHGYVLPTNGRGVVMLRFDDYPQDFATKVLPLLRKYDLPAYWACTIRHVDQEQPIDWATVQNWFLQDGVRIWNHSKTHSDSTTSVEIADNIVGAADYFESKMPHVAIDGWVAPGTGANPPYNDFETGKASSYYGTYAGRLIMQRHGIVNGGTGGYMQPMGGNAVGQSHYTFEVATVADFKAQVTTAQAGPYALSMMAHPKNLGTAGYMSMSDFESCLAWLAAERDAGRLMVLTGDVAPVLTPGGGKRNDLLPTFSTGALADTKFASLDTAPVWWAGGGVREFEVTVTTSAQTVIELEVTGASAKKKQFTIPSGTSTIRTFFGMPRGFTTLNFWIRRVSGGTATVNEAHVYAA